MHGFYNNSSSSGDMVQYSVLLNNLREMLLPERHEIIFGACYALFGTVLTSNGYKISGSLVQVLGIYSLYLILEREEMQGPSSAGKGI